MNEDYWIILYIFFEINLIKELGYDTDLIKYANNNKDNTQLIKIKIDEYSYEIPNYLINKKIPSSYTNLLIRKSLYFTRSIILNKFFIPNNLIFPKSRVIFENYFN